MKNISKIAVILSFGFFLSAERNANAQVNFSYTGSMQTWTVPCGATQLTITATGGGGGGSTDNSVSGGHGATIIGVVSVASGDVLDIITAGVGTENPGDDGGAGGGGSIIYDATSSTLLEVAGGGGGSYWIGSPGWDASTTITPSGSNGGAGENGGGSVAYDAGGGGAGFLSDGSSANYGGGYAGAGGSDFNNGSAGGAGDIFYDASVTGGFGGGGGAGYDDGGGGGGYNGGGSGAEDGGGGGGSFVNGTMLGSSDTCLGNGFVMITLPANVLQDSLGSITYPACNGDTGNATVVAFGGALPYTYTWTPSAQTTAEMVGVTAGVYTVTVQDNAGCSVTALASITQPTALNVILFVVNNETCNGGDNAHIASFPSGGSTPYTYTWSPSGGTKDTAYDITAGTYTLTLTDNHGCTASASAGVSQPVPVVVSASTTTNVTCRGGFDGSTTSNVVSGGVPPFTYSWSGGGGTNTFANGLSAGTYTMTVTDNNGCMGTASTVVTQPNALAVVPSLTTPVSCEGGNNGVALATPNGGTGPYTYSWFTSGGTNASASGLSAGTYTVTVNDICGNSATASIAVTQVATLTVSANTSSNALCNGASDGAASSSVSGGSVPYTYSWSGGGGSSSTASGLSSGTYTLTVHDKNGCVSTATTFIGEPAAFSIIKSSVPDDGHCTGSAWVTVSGGTAPYTYSWSNGNTTTAVSNICKGDYCCTITDAHACKDSVCFKIVSDLGIEGISSNSGHISVYPNPNNGQFNLESTFDNGAYQVEIYNILGEKVYSTNLNTMNGGISPINIGNQPNGIYLYRVITDSGELLGDGKLIIQK